MNNKFDKEVNNILAKKIEKMEDKILKKLIIKSKNKKPKLPNTPGNAPAHTNSPAIQKGINKDFADSPMPLSVGV